MPKTLLLADDSVTIQKVVGISFASEDVTLVTVDNGDDAVKKARELRPDVILADVVMPGKNGYEVCEAVKADADLRHIPVLLLTGTFEAFDEERARAAGAGGHVAKPFEAQTLVDEVRRLLAGAAAAPAAPEPSPVAPPPAAPLISEPAPGAPDAAPRAEESFDFFDDDLGLATPAPDDSPLLSAPAGPVNAELPDGAFAFGDEEIVPAEIDGAMAGPPPLTSPDLPAGDHTVAILPDEPQKLPPSPMAAGGESFGADALDPVGTELGFSESSREERSNSDSLSPLDPTGRSAGGGFDFDFESERVAAPVADPVLPVEAADVAQATVLDPNGASGYDVSSSDLGDSMVSGPTSPLSSTPSEPVAETPPALPEEPFAEPPPIPIETLPDVPVEIEPLASFAISSPPVPETAAIDAAPEPMADTAPQAGDPIAALEPFEDAPMADAVVVPADEPEPRAAAQRLPDPQEIEPMVAQAASAALDEIGPGLKEQLHDTLEKIAWESFSDVTDKIVEQAVERVEKIAWEVIPQLAETLVREEIRKLKGQE